VELEKGASPGAAKVHPVCSSWSGRVRCQVGWVTDRPTTSSSPCRERKEGGEGAAVVRVRRAVCGCMVLNANRALCPPSPSTHTTCFTHLHVQQRHAAGRPWAGQGHIEVVASSCIAWVRD
jgi:hypothetical protein